MAADIYSNADMYGQGGWSWYTGSAGWFYKVGIQDILGIKKKDKQLKISPRIPIAWDGYKAIYSHDILPATAPAI